MRGLWRKTAGFKSFGARLTAAILLALFFIIGFSLGFNNFVPESFWRLGGLDQQKNMVVSALPLYGLSDREESAAFRLNELFAFHTIFTLSGGGFSSLSPAVALADSGEASSEPPPAEAEPEAPTGALAEEPEPSDEDFGGEAEEDAAAAEQPKLPLVGIYCTHSSETYLPTFGVEKVEGKNGGVYNVAMQLKESLEELGVGVVLSDAIHDYPDWSLSYQNSLKTMQKMKEDNPSLEVFIDVHRDALPAGVNTVASVNGEKAAKIMLVVGSDKRVSFPTWRQNLAFAQDIVSMLEELYPGVTRGVSVQDGRYNQHVSPKAILVEFGSTKNTLQEAKNAAEMLARVLYSLLCSGD